MIFRPLVGGPLAGKVVYVKNFGDQGIHLNIAVNAGTVYSIREDRVIKVEGGQNGKC